MASASIADLIVRGRSIILALMEELEFLNRHADLSEFIDEHFETRTNSPKQLQFPGVAPCLEQPKVGPVRLPRTCDLFGLGQF